MKAPEDGVGKGGGGQKSEGGSGDGGGGNGGGGGSAGGPGPAEDLKELRERVAAMQEQLEEQGRLLRGLCGRLGQPGLAGAEE